MSDNTLYYGDNLEILAQKIGAESVDLIYLDPPFNSNRAFNVIFKDSKAQVRAFDDSWHWTPQTDAELDRVIAMAPTRLGDALEGMRHLLGPVNLMAYLVSMAPRLLELHRVLRETGSLYLHCDPTASHYLKILLDVIFGPTRFRSEIVWRRTGAHNKMKRWGPVHDIILFYTKSDDFTWNQPRRPYMKGHVEEYFVKDDRGWKTAYYGNVLTGHGLRGGESGKPWRGIDPSAKGRHWAIPGRLLEELEEDVTGLSQHEKLDLLYEKGHISIEPGQAWPMYEHYLTPSDGQPATDLWTYQPYTEGTVFGDTRGIDADVRWLSPRDAERLGYQTQKPRGLLERILRASSNPGDLVLDPFCGCGTTVSAAHHLQRRWIGIDVTYIAIALIEDRLHSEYPGEMAGAYQVDGIPTDLPGAKALWDRNPLEFERWAVAQVYGKPNDKQVSDKGVDGFVAFLTTEKGKRGKAVVSVKGGKQLAPSMVRDLVGTVNTERADMGILITLEKPTKGMRSAAEKAGTYSLPHSPLAAKRFPLIQIITVEELLDRKLPDMPAPLSPYTQARVMGRPVEMDQHRLF